MTWKKVSTCCMSWKKSWDMLKHVVMLCQDVSTCCVMSVKTWVTDSKSRTFLGPKKLTCFWNFDEILIKKKLFSRFRPDFLYFFDTFFLQIFSPTVEITENRGILVQKMLKMFPYTFSFLSTYPNQKGPVWKKLPRRYCLVYTRV